VLQLCEHVLEPLKGLWLIIEDQKSDNQFQQSEILIAVRFLAWQLALRVSSSITANNRLTCVELMLHEEC